MNWEQKLAALQAFADTSICMRKPGDWYVHMRAELKGDGVLSSASGNGRTPEEAVEDHWRKVTAPGAVIVRDAMNAARREVRWNGFMWADDFSASYRARNPDGEAPHA